MLEKLKSIKKYKIISLVVIITCILCLCYKALEYQKLYDDILFFKLFDIGESKNQNKEEKENNKNSIYIFNVSYKKIDSKNISLVETLKKESLIENMLAPGIEGEFDIVLTTNLDTKYQVRFYSLNLKPYNLKFENLETKEVVNNLEELSLEGKLQKGTSKTIPIHWYWNYEETKEGDLQDTIDSKSIESYKFTINTIGEQWR